MSSNFRYFDELFVQLGLPADRSAIATYIHAHSPLHPSIRLEEAVFWSPAQAALLREYILDDSDWVGTVDQLNLALRAIQS
jgi:Protein of unknown function (DUF2789)